MSQEKYKNFSDDEIYILHRQAIESSYNIVSRYEDEQRQVHFNLMHELAVERKERGL